MGVDWFTCKNCGRTFPDCGYYVRCESCGEHWCSDGCAEEEGYKIEIDNEEEYSSSCKYCRKEDFDSEVLLDFALKELKLSRDELILKYKDQHVYCTDCLYFRLCDEGLPYCFFEDECNIRNCEDSMPFSDRLCYKPR